MGVRRKNLINSLGVTKLEERLLRLLRSDTGVKAFLINFEKTGREEVCREAWREIDSAMSEAEYKKAKAIMARQQHQNFR